MHKWIYFPGVGWLLSIYEDAIGNDRNIAKCVQVVINARSFLLATAGLFVHTILSRSRTLTVEVPRSIDGLPDKFGTQVNILADD